MSNLKDHQMLNRKRYYSPNKQNEMENKDYPYHHHNEHKKEEGELISMGDNRKDKMRRQGESHFQTGYRNDRDDRHSANFYDRKQEKYGNRYERNERDSKNNFNYPYRKNSGNFTQGNSENKIIRMNREKEDFYGSTMSHPQEHSRRRHEEFQDDYRGKDYQRQNYYKDENDSYKRQRRDDSKKYSDREKERKPQIDRKVNRGYSYSPEDNRHARHQEEDDRNFPTMKKKFNFLIVLPKNYFRYIEKEYNYLYSEIKKRVRDIDVFQYDHKVSNFADFLLRIDAAKVSAKAYAMKIVCEVLFECMKDTYQNMSYLKISILVPAHVVGFIIGIEGKNINTIRDLSGARIDVFQQDVAHKYRQIELQGSPDEISKAAEKIYKIVNKYYFFNQSREGGRYKKNYEDQDETRKKKIRLGARSKRDLKDDRKSSTRRSPNPNRQETRPDSNLHVRKYSEKYDNLVKQEDIYHENNLPPTNEIKSDPPSNLINQKSKSEDINKINSSNLKSSTFSEISTENNIKFSEKIDTPTNLKYSSATENPPTEMSHFMTNEFSQRDVSEDLKIPLNIVITNQHLNMLKNIRGNIFIEIENKFHCSISKKVEKLSNSEVNILTLSGSPEQNCNAIYSLQQAMMGKQDIFKN